MKQTKWVDRAIMLIVAILVVIGSLAVYSVTSYQSVVTGDSPEGSFVKHIIIVFFSVVFSTPLLSKLVPYRSLVSRRWVYLIFALSLLVLGGVSLFAPPAKGARAWIDFGIFSLQPSEFVKLTFIVALSVYLRDDFKKGGKPPLPGAHAVHNWLRAQWHFVKMVVVFLFVLFFLFIQPDIGGVVIFTVIFFVMMLAVWRGTLWQKAGVVALVFACYQVLVRFVMPSILSGYQLNRILVYLNPFSEAVSSNFSLQVRNSLYALVRGGWFGVGIGQSVQKTGYLPESQNDFILAIIGEEIGFVGVLVVLLLLFALIGLLYYRSATVTRPFHRNVLIGIATMFFIQTVLNVSGVVNLAPLTGVTLPFLSQGGSSTFASFLSIAVVLRLSRVDRALLSS